MQTNEGGAILPQWRRAVSFSIKVLRLRSAYAEGIANKHGQYSINGKKKVIRANYYSYNLKPLSSNQNHELLVD